MKGVRNHVLLVCAATGTEYDACLAGIRDADLAGSFEVLQVGVGPRHAARSLRERLARGPAPSRILSCGFAGALGEGVSLGAWITAETLSEWQNGSLVPMAQPIAVASCMPCDVVSVDHLVGRNSPLRRAPRPSARPLVADMESAALAAEASARGIALSVVRLVSDTPEHPLPEFLSPFTAAMAGSDARARTALLARGIGSALTDPRGVARLLVEGRTWTKKLREGFATLAPFLV
ncbi:hypothetical protein LVJ94_17730 [Pendulispora rubella]|uniref:Nucleoside phosphorylase domain-containing protein n=1 Tax=Pendulispora rubella TaxID=2741070 RepID=A0ABZ2LH11_9BACT